MTWKKYFILSIFIVISLVTISGFASSTDAGEELYEFDFNVQVPPTHSFTADVVEPWADLVEEKTDGRVKINIYTSGALGTLGTLDTAYEDIKGGVYDIGYIVPSLESETELFPLTIGELPFALSDPIHHMKVLTKFYEKYTVDAFDGVTLMSISSSDPYQLVSKDPVKSVEDVKNKKINAIGETSINLVNSWGGVPVTLELGSIYEGLEKGTLDQAIYPAIGSAGLSLYEVAPYLIQIESTAMTLAYIMNTDALNSLPEDLHNIFVEELNPRLAELAAEVYKSEQEKNMEKFVSRGGEIITLSAEELESFIKPTKDMWSNWVNEANNRGYPGGEMMEYFQSLLEEEGVEVPFSGD